MPRVRLIIAATLAASLSACVVAPYPRHVVYAEPVPAGVPMREESVVVDVAPPPPYVEVVPAVPYEGAVWIGGYWGWHGGRHEWFPGRWERGRPGYQWRAHSWVQQGGRWHLHEGGWVRR
jgi:hypothetical protein